MFFPTRGNVNTSQIRQGSQVFSTDSCLKDTAKGWQRVPVPSTGVGRGIPTHFKLSAATAREDWKRIKVGRVLKREGLTQEAWGESCLSVLREVVPHFHNQFDSICMRWLSIFRLYFFLACRLWNFLKKVFCKGLIYKGFFFLSCFIELILHKYLSVFTAGGSFYWPCFWFLGISRIVSVVNNKINTCVQIHRIEHCSFANQRHCREYFTHSFIYFSGVDYLSFIFPVD